MKFGVKAFTGSDCKDNMPGYIVHNPILNTAER